MASPKKNAGAPKKVSSRAKAREGKKALVGYFTTDVNQAMHDLAEKEGKTMQALIGEAVDLLMIDRGYPPFKET